MKEEQHSAWEWQIRQFKNDYDLPVPEGGFRHDALVFDKDGKCLNEMLWEDPKIKEGTNFNVITDQGKIMMWNTLFALSGSGVFNWMAYGASGTGASHTGYSLSYELIADGTRITLTNQLGTMMTSGSVVSLNTYTDTTYTPNINYYTQAAVMGTINGATTLNVGQPVQEFGIASKAACPSTPSGISGVLFNWYDLSSPITITGSSTIQILLTLRA